MIKEVHDPSRRRFLRSGIIAGAMLPLINPDLFASAGIPAAEKLKVYIFSKHLQFLDYKSMAEAAAEMGFDGVDITVRPNGHVLPENVETDLPKSADAMKGAGLKPFLMTTAVDDAGDPGDKKVLEVASSLGFEYYRMNWYPYPEEISMPKAIERYASNIKVLGTLNRQLKLTGCYQNHAGKLVGASMWELWQLLKDADPKHVGVQYDIRHGMVEGGQSWENGLRLVHENIKLLTIKDFRWATENGKSVVEDVPMGQGTVDFKHYFKLLKQYNINVPVSLHIEYPLGGAEHGATKIKIDKREVFNAMKRDLQFVRKLWEES